MSSVILHSKSNSLVRLLCHVGIPTLVFLTKVDEYDPELRTKGFSSVFSSARIAAIMTVREHPGQLQFILHSKSEVLNQAFPW